MENGKIIIKNKNRILIMALAVAVIVSITASAMTVNNFTDYNPPSTLVIDWYDYFMASLDKPSSNNSATEWPRWSAVYPYRALFLGRKNGEKTYQYIMIYSKQPTTTLFTFDYLGESKSTDKYGYIRAKINTTAYTSSTDIAIHYIQFSDTTSVPYVTHPSFWGTYTTLGHTDGSSTYFDFDFYYDCTNKHQQNTQLLSVSGLRSISVPYAYILTCDGHGSGGGSSSGSSSGGSSSSGSGSNGSSSSKNTSGDGGRHGWGNGEYGGGVDKDKIVSGNDGGGYPDYFDKEFSVPDYWKEPIEDNYNSMPQSEYKPDFPEYIPAEGDTGQTGQSWELPSFGSDDGVSGSINGYKELIPYGEYGLIDFMAPMEEWLK